MKKKILKFLKFLQKGIERKHYLEFITAALSIPVLITVLVLNLSSLNGQKKNTVVTPTPQVKEIIIHDNTGVSPRPTDIPSCRKEVGPVTISYPKEGATVTDNPVNFIISYEDEAYCSVVWSYRINNGTWSEYSSNSPSIYNMPNGQIKFDLRVQSTVSQDQQVLSRTFNYQGAVVTPTSVPVPSSTPTP